MADDSASIGASRQLLQLMMEARRLGGVIRAGVLASVAVAMSHAAISAEQRETGNITGRVLDARLGTPMPGAIVTLEGSALQTVTGADGRFRLVGVPIGHQIVAVGFLGRPTTRVHLTVRSAEPTRLEIELSAPIALEERVTVSASPMGEGAARALSQRKTALSIVNVVSSEQIGQFPNVNAAEATQRIPGVAIEREKGEGRYVMIRGTEPRLSSIMVNGERIPSPENDLRQVALDVIPIDLLETVHVSKTLTADMDADAIGGAVNLVTKTAQSRPRTLATLAGGYSESQNSWGQGLASLAAGRRFRGDRLGLIGTASYRNHDRGRDTFETTYTEGNLEELQVRHYSTNRAHTGLSGTLDYQFSGNHQAFVRTMFSELPDRELRRRTSYQVTREAIARSLSDRVETLTVGNVQAGAQHLLDTGVQIDYRASAAYAEEREPGRLDTTFAQRGVQFAPNVSPAVIDPENVQAHPLNEDVSLFTLVEQATENNLATDRDVVGAFNARFPLVFSRGLAGTLKTGAKYRDRRKTGDDNVTRFDGAGDVLLPEVGDARLAVGSILDGRYVLGPHVDPESARALLDQTGGTGTVVQEENLADYEASEQTVAAYAMAELAVGSRMTVVPGVRVEDTHIDYTGFELQVDDDAASALDVVRSSRRDTHVFPGIQGRLALTTSSNLRAAVTRSMARPNYADLVPFQLIVRQDNEIRRGNPDLQSTTAWNYDLMVEHYLDSVGVLSAGVFYKDLTDYIFPLTTRELRDGALFNVLSPRNGDAARVRGIELAFQNQLSILPRPFDGFGVLANYTYTDSETMLPGREPTPQRLPGQASHVGNVAVWYEKSGFSAQASFNFRDWLLFEVGSGPAHDVYLDSHYQVDLSVSQVLTEQVRFFIDVVNVTDQPVRFYEGTDDRPIEEEYSSWWLSFGVRLAF